jgi:predicted hydrolase (HD superfamily)
MTYSKFDTTGNETQHLFPQVTQLASLQKQIISMAANLKRYAQKENDDEETDDGLIR